ncbi:hypothetical protein AALP_AA4G016800 [Arabis alpina]|uniref:HTH myb-type domain-containing protein n=1 Tax=Arabis alpina TaxID=50452 RepID=A0A087H0I5_ARAAL|nr:hypothetical protein AALP_AA4G016800 [Arabis alpina]
MMEVEGISLHHVKSHLQKFRLGKCNIRDKGNQYNKRLKTVRGIAKTCASRNLPRQQVNIRPKVTGAVNAKKVKEIQGSLYMLIERDFHLQRCREAQRMQMTSGIEKQHNMFEAQYLKARTNASITTHIVMQLFSIPYYHQQSVLLIRAL